MNVIDSLKDHVQKIMDNDSAHDFNHIMRVFKNAKKICKKEKANEKSHHKHNKTQLPNSKWHI